jgi:hypothetical protein
MTKNEVFNKLMGELEAYLGRPADEWGTKEIDLAQDVVELVNMELQDLGVRL